MKNKIKLIDFNMISSYLGRSSTVVVALIVLGITIGALVWEGGVRDHQVLTVAVPRGTELHYEPLRALIARQMGRTARLVPATDSWPQDCELYLLPTDAYRRGTGGVELAALYNVERMESRRDRAVLIASSAGPSIDLSAVSPADAVFVSRSSINGCWVQLHAMAEKGIKMPATLDELQFVSSSGGGERIVYGVIHGRYRLGACLLSDIETLSRSGRIEPDEVTVVLGAPAMPEMVVACRREDVAYFKRKMERLVAALTAPGNRDAASVQLLRSRGVCGLTAVDDAQLVAFDKLVDFIDSRF